MRTAALHPPADNPSYQQSALCPTSNAPTAHRNAAMPANAPPPADKHRAVCPAQTLPPLHSSAADQSGHKSDALSGSAGQHPTQASSFSFPASPARNGPEAFGPSATISQAGVSVSGLVETPNAALVLQLCP